MKTVRMLVMTFGALALLSTAAAALTADEVVAKALEAQGGRAALDAINTQKATGKVLTQGLEIAMTMTYARPERMRVDATVMNMTIVQCFDGSGGWSVNPMSGSQDAQPMSEVETRMFKLQSDLVPPYVDCAKKGYTSEYLGQEDVEGTPAHRLRVDTKQDVVLDFWFDAETFLLLKQNSKIAIDQGEFETQTYPSDYRQQDGLTIPFSLESRRGDQVMTQITFDKVETNVAVDESIFVMPPKAAPAAATPDSTGN